MNPAERLTAPHMLDNQDQTTTQRYDISSTIYASAFSAPMMIKACWTAHQSSYSLRTKPKECKVTRLAPAKIPISVTSQTRTDSCNVASVSVEPVFLPPPS